MGSCKCTSWCKFMKTKRKEGKFRLHWIAPTKRKIAKFSVVSKQKWFQKLVDAEALRRAFNRDYSIEFAKLEGKVYRSLLVKSGQAQPMPKPVKQQPPKILPNSVESFFKYVVNTCAEFFGHTFRTHKYIGG